jgi:hypothetical protein
MDLLGSFQGLVALVLGIGALALTGFAFVDAARRPAEAFTYAGKRTKVFWLVILGIAMLVTFVIFQWILSLFGILTVVAAAVYLVDVRPAVRQYRGGRGGGSRGPYGGW